MLDPSIGKTIQKCQKLITQIEGLGLKKDGAAYAKLQADADRFAYTVNEWENLENYTCGKKGEGPCVHMAEHLQLAAEQVRVYARSCSAEINGYIKQQRNAQNPRPSTFRERVQQRFT